MIPKQTDSYASKDGLVSLCNLRMHESTLKFFLSKTVAPDVARTAMTNARGIERLVGLKEVTEMMTVINSARRAVDSRSPLPIYFEYGDGEVAVDVTTIYPDQAQHDAERLAGKRVQRLEVRHSGDVVERVYGSTIETYNGARHEIEFHVAEKQGNPAILLTGVYSRTEGVGHFLATEEDYKAVFG